MKRLIQYYMAITAIICCATLSAGAIVKINEKSSEMAFGTQPQKIQLSTYINSAELKDNFTWIFSFLPSRE